MRVRVIRKFADVIDGVDLSRCAAGDLIGVTDPEARLLIAEGWAKPARRVEDSGTEESGDQPHEVRRSHGERRASDRPADIYQRLEDKRDQIETDRRHTYRRAADHRNAA